MATYANTLPVFGRSRTRAFRRSLRAPFLAVPRCPTRRCGGRCYKHTSRTRSPSASGCLHVHGRLESPQVSKHLGSVHEWRFHPSHGTCPALARTTAVAVLEESRAASRDSSLTSSLDGTMCADGRVSALLATSVLSTHREMSISADRCVIQHPAQRIHPYNQYDLREGVTRPRTDRRRRRT